MKVDDLEQATHLGGELKRLRDAQTRLLDETPNRVRCLFFKEDDDPMSSPPIEIAAYDQEFSQMYDLAQRCLRRDIAEIVATLKTMGVVVQL